MVMKKLDIVSYLLVVLLAIICGASAGAVAGSIVSRQNAPVLTVATSTQPLPTASTTAAIPTFSILPLERMPASSLVPPFALSRRSSSLAVLYRKPKAGTLEERVLTDDRMLGQAVSLTSDGWFVTEAAAIEGLRFIDMTIWHDGQSYAPQRIMLDHLNQTAFIKIDATGFPSSAFTHVSELAIGAEVWLETRPEALRSTSVVDLRTRVAVQDVVGSEVASRRITLDRMTAAGDRGGAVWDPNGSLVGIVESKEGEPMRIVPASGIAASFSSLLSTGEIRHAVLGVRSIDLAVLRIDGSRGVLPAAGAWIHDDKKGAKPGVVRDSPAFKSKLQTGDVILRVERDILDGTADLGEVLAEYRPGASVTLRVLRAGVDTDVKVDLGTVVTGELVK